MSDPTNNIYPPNLCLSTLRATQGKPYSRGAEANLFNHKKVSPILDFDLPDFHRFRRDHANRISISGVQDKLSVKIEKGKLVPTSSEGEYILKPMPSTPGLEYQCQVPANEHLTMQIAAQFTEIEVPPNGLVFFSDGSSAYLVKRFDRDAKSGEKLPQEDFCQLAGRTQKTHGENYKYNGSYQDIGEILKKYCPLFKIEIEKLYRVILFNYLFGNGDAHYKNFSIVPTQLGDFSLSPAYDLLNTNLHLPAESRTALDLFSDDFESDSFKVYSFYTLSDFRELARRFGMIEKRVERINREIINSAEASTALISRSLLSEPAKKAYLAVVNDRALALSL